MYWGDERRVRQIVVNLLTNAIKFTAPGGRITISCGTGETVTGASLAGLGPWAYVRVEDTGRPQNWQLDRYNGTFASGSRTGLADRLGIVGAQQLSNWRKTLKFLSNFDMVRWPRG